MFPVGLHGDVCFQQGGIGPVGNPGPQGIKGFQVSRLSALVSIFMRISRLLTARLLQCSAGG